LYIFVGLILADEIELPTKLQIVFVGLRQADENGLLVSSARPQPMKIGSSFRWPGWADENKM
jgi:hypothetical protein